jgi:hypothetical protein
MPEFNTVFVNFDFGPSHALINDALNSDDVETARTESEKVLKAQKDIKQSTKAIGGTVVFETGANLIVNIPFDKELIESMSDIYAETTGTPANIGIGKTVIESHNSVAAIRGSQRGHIIIGSAIKEDFIANRLFYKQAKKENYDLRISEIIKLALSELAIITTEEKVYDIFLRLIKENGLDSVDDIRTYFFQPVEELKEGIRMIYKRQATGCLLYAMPAPMALFPKDGGSDEMITLYHASPNIPTEGNWMKGTYFTDNEQDASYYAASHHEGDINVQKVTIPKRLVQKNKSNDIYILKEEYPIKLSLKEGKATGCLLYAIQTPSAPGQSVINRNPKQKSPHRKHNWWSMEEYNDGVDWRKTDVQYVGGNVTQDSQDMSMGGENGEAIATT